MLTVAHGESTMLKMELLTSNKFWVEIDGMLEAAFTECSGLQATTETLPVKEGGLNSHVHLLPVRTTFSNLTLKRGIGMTEEFWDWYNKTVQGKPEKRDITILLFSPNKPGMTSKAWSVSNAYPIKWGGPTFNSKTQEFAIESIELAYDWFKPAKDRIMGL